MCSIRYKWFLVCHFTNAEIKVATGFFWKRQNSSGSCLQLVRESSVQEEECSGKRAGNVAEFLEAKKHQPLGKRN